MPEVQTEMFMESEVRAGLALLDGKFDGWRGRVDLAKLDMNHMDNCIIGQLFGTYEDGKVELGLSWGQLEEYGFDVPESLIDYSTSEPWEHVSLGNTWKTLMAA